ncbi:hypothetical protein J6590_059824 [Homalodisca vitripennis]|nr:hypothetical protein J6590_059824 [Homalodisca vitripennis]
MLSILAYRLFLAYLRPLTFTPIGAHRNDYWGPPHPRASGITSITAHDCQGGPPPAGPMCRAIGSSHRAMR